MNASNAEKNESRLESVISYVLIAGVIISLTLEVIGLALYLHTYHTSAISYASAFKIQGHDFFSFLWGLPTGSHGGAAISLMVAGIAVLLLTPYLRVLLSVLFFGAERNYKFVFITLFVLIVLTVSLTLH